LRVTIAKRMVQMDEMRKNIVRLGKQS